MVEGVDSGRGEELGPLWQPTSPDKKAWHVQRPEDKRKHVESGKFQVVS